MNASTCEVPRLFGPFSRPRVARSAVLVGTLLVVLLSACAGPPTDKTTSSPHGATPPAAAPDGPSVSAQQVCSPDDGQPDIARALGTTPTRVEPPTWQDHLYTCRYDYPNGSFTLSVKELPGDSQTIAYLDQLATKLGRVQPLDGIGETAFYTRDGSIVARKDFKVLLVDVSRLPAKFGDLADSPAEASRTIATVIMGCWSGA